MIAREPCFFHGAILTTDDEDFVSEVQWEDNFPKGLTKQISLRIIKPD